MSGLPHLKFFSKGVDMETCPTTKEIKHQLETLVLTAILNVLSRLTSELSAMNEKKEMKF